jgi:hypothetical protein
VSWVLLGIVAISILVNGLALIRDILLSTREFVRTVFNKCQKSKNYSESPKNDKNVSKNARPPR